MRWLFIYQFDNMGIGRESMIAKSCRYFRNKKTLSQM